MTHPTEKSPSEMMEDDPFKDAAMVSLDSLMSASYDKGYERGYQAATSAPQWRDISSAPKDGTPIQVVGFSESANIPVTVFWSKQHEAWCLDDGENCYVSDVNLNPFMAYEPTHWQPLPAAPTKEDV